jgi:hypothetical protein
LLRYFPSDGDVRDKAEFEALKAEKNWPFGADITLDDMRFPFINLPPKPSTRF